MFKECHVLRSLVTDQTEKAFFHRLTFFVDQTFQTALLFMLNLGQLKVIPLSQGLHCRLQITVSVLCQRLMEACCKVCSPGTTISHTLGNT